jgi:hypothetical protein
VSVRKEENGFVFSRSANRCLREGIGGGGMSWDGCGSGVIAAAARDDWHRVRRDPAGRNRADVANAVLHRGAIVAIVLKVVMPEWPDVERNKLTRAMERYVSRSHMVYLITMDLAAVAAASSSSTPTP